MARRGEALREHILDTAKLAFLEDGFERTSMDAIAARAETSKRPLYAHFPTKDVGPRPAISRRTWKPPRGSRPARPRWRRPS